MNQTSETVLIDSQKLIKLTKSKALFSSLNQNLNALILTSHEN